MKGRRGYKKGFWTVEEDRILMEYVRKHGKGRWNRVANMTGLRRCGKSCRIRWINYLCPSVNRDDFTEEEDDLIIRLHKLLGNRWSLIAGRVPGRTDNQIKNHWNTYLSKKLGVKNEKSNEVKASPSQTPFTAMEAEENFNVSMETNYCAASVPPANQKAIEDGVENTNKLFDGLELAMNDGSESSFWLVNDDIYNLNTPDLTELLDPCSLDFIWNDSEVASL